MEQILYNANTIQECLKTKRLGHNILFYESIGSTNEQAHLIARQESARGIGAVRPEDSCDHQIAEPDRIHGTLLVADKQTAGKGRRGRTWDSPAGTNVYFTLLLKPTFAPDKAPMLTLLMAYAVREAVQEQVTGLQEQNSCCIKWPNDIVLNGKKICGILTEMHLEGTSIHHVAIGVGINVGKQDFATDLVDKATSLEAECGQAFSRSRLLADILQIFEAEYEAFAANGASQNLQGLRDRYNSCLVNRDREVCVLDPKGEYRGVARGINDTGELLVELADGKVTEVYAGEVSVRGIYGYV